MGVCVCVCVCVVCVCVLSHVRLFATPWTVARQAPLSMGFPRQEYWSGLPCPSPGVFPTQGQKPGYLGLLHWHSLPLCHLGSPEMWHIFMENKTNKNLRWFWSSPQGFVLITLGGSLRCDCSPTPHSTSSHWKYEWPDCIFWREEWVSELHRLLGWRLGVGEKDSVFVSRLHWRSTQKRNKKLLLGSPLPNWVYF